MNNLWPYGSLKFFLVLFENVWVAFQLSFLNPYDQLPCLGRGLSFFLDSRPAYNCILDLFS